MTLKIKYSRNASRNLSHFTNFPANIFLFGVRKNICTASFLGAKELHSWSTLKANVYIFLYIFVRKFLFQRRSKILSGLERRIDFFKGGRCNWNFRKSIIFSISILPSIALKRWNFPYIFDLRLNFSYEVTFSQYKTIWQQNNKLKMVPFKRYVTCIMAFFTLFNFVTLHLLYSITSLCHSLNFIKGTNADMKIYQHLRLHIKILYWRFRIMMLFTFWNIRTRGIWNVCLQTYRNNRTS